MEEVKQKSHHIPISLRGKKVTLWDAYYFNDLITKWQPTREVWPFVHGDSALGSLASVSGAYSSYWMRRNLKLVTQARLAVYCPTVALAYMNSIIMQKAFVTSEIIRKGSCSSCAYVKAATVQVVGGFLIPLSIASMVSFYAADCLLTYPVPSFVKAPREAKDLIMKFLYPRRRVFFAWGVIHALAAVAVTYAKENCYSDLEIMCNISRE